MSPTVHFHTNFSFSVFFRWFSLPLESFLLLTKKQAMWRWSGKKIEGWPVKTSTIVKPITTADLSAVSAQLGQYNRLHDRPSCLGRRHSGWRHSWLARSGEPVTWSVLHKNCENLCHTASVGIWKRKLSVVESVVLGIISCLYCVGGVEFIRTEKRCEHQTSRAFEEGRLLLVNTMLSLLEWFLH